MAEKKIFSTRVDKDKIENLKRLAVDTDKSCGDLSAEARGLLIRKDKNSSAKQSCLD